MEITTLRQQRIALGLSLDDVARCFPASRQRISQIETAERVSPETLDAYRAALDAARGALTDALTDSTALAPREGITHRSESSLALLRHFLTDCRNRGLANATIVRYSQIGKEFFQRCSGLKPWEIKPHDIREYLSWLVDRGVTEHTLQQTLSALRSIFRFAEEFEVVSVSPARLVRQRKYKRSIPRPLSEEEIERLIDGTWNIRDRAIVEFFYSTGCRISEVVSARLEDVSWSERTVRVIGKGDKERLVPLSGRAVQSLRQYLGLRSAGWLFQADNLRPCNLARNRQGLWEAHWYEVIQTPDGTSERRFIRRTLGKTAEMSEGQASNKIKAILTERRGTLQPTIASQLSRSRVRHVIDSAARAAGLGHVHPHQIRHSFATHLLDHGADLFTIKEFLGHSLLTTTEIYTHVSQTKMRETLERCHPHWKQAGATEEKQP